MSPEGRTIADPGGGGKGFIPASPVQYSKKKMVAERGDLYFMFVGPHFRNFWIRY